MLVVDAQDAIRRHDVIAAALRGGVDTVQLRDPRATGLALAGAGAALRAATRAAGALLMVNERIDVALAIGADGVHLPAASFPTTAARRVLAAGGRPDALVGRSTHAGSEAEAAAAEGVDYVVLGPIYATPSKAAWGAPLGVDALAATHALAPVLAIGGVEAARIPALRKAGAAGVAVIRAILDAPDPENAARTLADALAAES